MHSVKDVDDYVQTFLFNDDGTMKVGFVVKLLHDKKDVKSAAETIATLCGEPVNKSALTAKLRRVAALFKKYRGYNLKLESNRRALLQLLNDTFVVPQGKSSEEATATLLPSAVPSTPMSPSQPSPSTVPSTPMSPSQPSPSADQQCQSVLAGSLRGDCDRCNETRVSSAAAVTTLRRQLSATKSTLAAVKSTYKVKTVNVFKKRKREQIESKKAKIKEQEKTIASLQKQLEKLNKQCLNQQNEISDLQRKIRSLEKDAGKDSAKSKQMRLLEKKINSLERELEVTQNLTLASDSSLSDIDTKADGKTYSESMRKAIYHCLCCQVPTESVGSVLQYSVKTLTGKSLSKVPDATTAAQMIVEIGVLSDLQVCEAIMEADCVNLAWDATTVDGKHLNEIHINTPSTSLTVTTQQIPGGTAADYAEQIIDALSQLSELHADYNNISGDIVQAEFKSKILSTLTDRAAANHATVEILEQKLNIQLLELKCHLHPLDGLANSARSLLKECDRKKDKSSHSFGSDCCAANVLYAISKLRYKAKGDPSTFKSFLKSKGKSCSTFARYVGNRLHVFFHLAGTVVQHKELLMEYLEAFCNATALASAVLKDLRDPYIFTQLCAVGWMGKLITGPWMALIYTPMLERNHLAMGQHIKMCLAQISVLEDCPELVFSTTSDIFGKPLIDDDTLKALRLIEFNDELLNTLSALASSFKTLLGRQLHQYVAGPLSEPDQNIMTQASAAPAHNIWAERCLGMVDAQVRRAPNATMTFIDAKVKCKINHTLKWLDDKPAEVQQNLVAYAVGGAARKKRRDKQRMEDVSNAIAMRMKERGQKRDMAYRNKLGRNIKAAFAEGGLGMGAEIFVNLETQLRTLLEHTMANKDHIVGSSIRHIWNVEGKNISYNGRIIEVKHKKKGVEITVGYWLEEQTEDEASDYKLSWNEFVADLMLGDLLFLDF